LAAERLLVHPHRGLQVPGPQVQVRATLVQDTKVLVLAGPQGGKDGRPNRETTLVFMDNRGAL
jgi:hypothetical protein